MNWKKFRKGTSVDPTKIYVAIHKSIFNKTFRIYIHKNGIRESYNGMHHIYLYFELKVPEEFKKFILME